MEEISGADRLTDRYGVDPTEQRPRCSGADLGADRKRTEFKAVRDMA